MAVTHCIARSKAARWTEYWASTELARGEGRGLTAINRPAALVMHADAAKPVSRSAEGVAVSQISVSPQEPRSNRIHARIALKRVPDHSLDWGVLKLGRSCLASAGLACRSCVDVCRAGALRRVPHGHAGCLVLASTHCTRCGDCVQICPVSALELNA